VGPATKPDASPPRKPFRTKATAEKSDVMRWVAMGGAVMCVIALIGGIVVFFINRPAEARTEVPVAASISATELWTEYDRDGAAANRKYGNKFLVIKGKVARLPPNSRTPSLTLETPSTGRWTIECNFLKKEELAGLAAGQEITVRGECEPRSKGNLVLMTCALVPSS
jgi:hypothetical protein